MSSTSSVEIAVANSPARGSAAPSLLDGGNRACALVGSPDHDTGRVADWALQPLRAFELLDGGSRRWRTAPKVSVAP